MLVKIDDEIIARYQAHPDTAKLPLEQVLNRRLAWLADYPLTSRVVILSGDQLAEIEALLGGAQIQRPADLLQRIQVYSQVKLGTVVIPLTLAEKDELAYRAQKQGKPVGDLVRDLIAQLHDSLFNDTVPVR